MFFFVAKIEQKLFNKNYVYQAKHLYVDIYLFIYLLMDFCTEQVVLPKLENTSRFTTNVPANVWWGIEHRPEMPQHANQQHEIFPAVPSHQRYRCLMLTTTLVGQV